MAKRYYWLKLKADWFGSKLIKKLRRIAGGDTYTIIYLKMQLLSLKNEGKLYYEGIEDDFAEELASDLEEDIENVRVTLNFLHKHKMIEMVEEDEYLLSEVKDAVGSESESAARVRKHRDIINKKEENQKLLQCNADVTECNALVTACNTEIEKEIEKDKRDIYNTSCPELQNSGPEPEPIITLPLNTGEEYPIFQRDIDEFAELYPAVDVLQAMRGMRGWLSTNPERRKTKRGIRRFINSWLSKEQDRGGNVRNESKARTNQFHNFPQREYDYQSLESQFIQKVNGGK